MNIGKILKVILWIAKLIVSIGRANKSDQPQLTRQQRRKLQRELKKKKEC
ncbi:hypothetical protein [Flyfo microvirus Tbat2_103]|nr:hypothetical protein [Flyfo microvirus Tbat2_103]